MIDNNNILQKLDGLEARYEEVSTLITDPSVIADQSRYVKLTKEYKDLGDIMDARRRYINCLTTIKEAKDIIANESDAEMKEMAREELAENEELQPKLEEEIKILLVPKDPEDAKNVQMEIRGGAGGDEAALFAGDLFNMYKRYCDKKGWKLSITSVSEGAVGGLKEIDFAVEGENVYGTLKYESGVHRVQRVPKTESQGRIHTSACTVAVMPELPESEMPEINPADLRIDTYRSSGAGGQHVNTTDSAVRITHIPTGIVVECQDERSQHKNKAKAMSVLASRIVQAEQERQAAEQADTRRNLLGSGDRSDKIRTYNYPQGRVTDHRINLTLYRLDEVMNGKIDELIQPIITEYQADQLAALSESN